MMFKHLRQNRTFLNILTTVFPILLIPDRSWLTLWRQRDHLIFVTLARFYHFGMMIAYLLHIPFVDIPAKKEPLWLWVTYRLAGASANLFGALCTYFRIYSNPIHSRGIVFIIATFCVFIQSKSMEWNDQIPFVYVPILALLGTLTLRLSIVPSAVAIISMLVISYRSFTIRPHQTHHMVSASLVALLIAAWMRSREKQDILLFIAEQYQDQTRKSLIEAQRALVEQLRKFFPREIYSRIENQMLQYGKTPDEAVEEILRPKDVIGAVLYTDIRGFTGLTKLGKNTVLSAIIPAQKLCTDLIEERHGVPRLQGDLVYAYFDNESSYQNIVNATLAAIDLSLATNELNKDLPSNQTIIRYVIITFGQLTVGNIGGSEGSRDISVLGLAANLPVRIDVLTKEPAVQVSLAKTPIIFSGDAKDSLLSVFPDIQFHPIDLKALNLSIKDFPDETMLFLMELSNEIRNKLTKSPDIERHARYLEDRFNATASRNKNKKAA